MTESPGSIVIVLLTMISVEIGITVTSIVLLDGSYSSFPVKLTDIIVVPFPTAVILPETSATAILSLDAPSAFLIFSA